MRMACYVVGWWVCHCRGAKSDVRRRWDRQHDVCTRAWELMWLRLQVRVRVRLKLRLYAYPRCGPQNTLCSFWG